MRFLQPIVSLCLIGSFSLPSAFCDHPKGERVTSVSLKKNLVLKGESGDVVCRVYGNPQSASLPKRSPYGTYEFSFRTFLRMKNLTAVRGFKGKSMIGPADYFGNLESPHKYWYSIDLNGKVPSILRKEVPSEDTIELKEPSPSMIRSVKYNWISGKDRLLAEKAEEYKVKKTDKQQSLFLKPGILELEVDHLILPSFDPRGIDFRSFRARLVPNDSSFKITSLPLPTKDEFRVVTFLYEKGYAKRQMRSGSGLFLESHDFAQTLTPLQGGQNGFAVLAKETHNSEKLEMIAVQIPYGWTLIIDKGAIHGDATFQGFYMMTMTTDHGTMGTADTVFLKSKKSKKNLVISVEHPLKHEGPSQPNLAPPLVLYNTASQTEKKEFFTSLSVNKLMFNPFNSQYWKAFLHRYIRIFSHRLH